VTDKPTAGEPLVSQVSQADSVERAGALKESDAHLSSPDNQIPDPEDLFNVNGSFTDVLAEPPTISTSMDEEEST
jgi:hypothetical protein